jgi:ribosomal protein S27AE
MIEKKLNHSGKMTPGEIQRRQILLFELPFAHHRLQ